MRALTIALCLLATPARADMAGTASVIDGDTIEVHGQRIRYSLNYVDQEADAQAARRGIWGSEFVKPWEWRRGKRLDTGN